MNINASRTAVIAVHMQNDIATPEGAFAEFFAQEVQNRDIIASVGFLLESARASGALSVLTRVAWQPGYPDLVANSPLLRMVREAECLVDGSTGAAIVDALKPQTHDVVVTHQRVNCFHASLLDLTLRSRGCDTVVLAGVATNVSVEGTARRASDLGYRTIVVSDACSAAHDGAHNSALESLELLAEVATLDDVTAALRQRGTPGP